MVDLFVGVRMSQEKWFAMAKSEKGLKFVWGSSRDREIKISQNKYLTILSIHSFCKEAMSEMLETVLRSLM